MKQFCPVCMAYMQHLADPINYQSINKYHRCPTCGFTKLAKEQAMAITLNDWVTSSGRYPERAKSKELTDEVKANAEELLKRVNAALKELGIEKASVSSGFRPSDANRAAGGAKKSGHTIGLSIDILDINEKIDGSFDTKEGQDVLEKYKLWQEHPSKTKNWSHIDMVTRPIRPRTNCKKRQFLP